jgi:hypothetical protein
MEGNKERVDILNAVGELRKRLQSLKHRTDCMRSDVLGEDEKCEVPETFPSAHLDGKVSECFPLLEQIEGNISRLIIRLGVNDAPVQTASKPSRSAVGY